MKGCLSDKYRVTLESCIDEQAVYVMIIRLLNVVACHMNKTSQLFTYRVSFLQDDTEDIDGH